MKTFPRIYCLLSLCFIAISSQLLGQPPQKKDSTSSAFSRLGTHISGFGDYIEEHKKILFKRILLPEPVLEAYVEQRLKNLPEESKIHLTENSFYQLTYIPAPIFEELREVNPSTPANLYRIAGSRACHALKDGRYAFELYNGDALIAMGLKEAKALQKLRIVRGPAGTAHWEMPLSQIQTDNFLHEGPELIEENQIDSGKVYVLTSEELLFVPTEASPGILFSDKISLLHHLDMLSFYESEASKYLSNQLVDGEILIGLEKRLIYLSEPQLNQVFLRHEAENMPSYSDEFKRVLKLGQNGFLLWHPTYNYARYFISEADLLAYVSSDDYSGQPELLFESVLRQYGDSLVAHAPELTNYLSASGTIEKEKLDGSLGSLDELATALNWQRSHLYQEEMALSVLAYTGEVLRKAKKGKWILKEDPKSKLLLPKIQSGKGQYDDVMELALKFWPKD